MRDHLYIDGRWVKPARFQTFAVLEPSTGALLHNAPAATAEDVDAAVLAARAAFDTGGWPQRSGAERARYLRAIAAGIRTRVAELARLEVLDIG